MAGVPYTFGTATTSIPLSNLDSNFVTPVTIGNASVALGNTITAIGNLTLNNVTINSGTINASVSESYSLANAVVYSNSSNVGVTSSNLTFDGTTLTANTIKDSALTSTQVVYSGAAGLLTSSANMTFNGTTFTLANDASISGLTVGKGGGSVSNNTVVGNGALTSSATGQWAVAIGASAMPALTSGVFNTAVGGVSMYSNTSGAYNAAFGSQSLRTNTTGSFNTSIGEESLYSNTTASNNTAVGYQAGYSNTTGTQNCYFGQLSAYSNTVGSQNCAFGQGSLNASTGGNNTAIGFQALVAATTATYNTAVGTGAGYAITTGSKNTIIGAYGGNQGGLDIRTASNYIVLSDGDGNPRQVIDNGGKVLIGKGASNDTVVGIELQPNGYTTATTTSSVNTFSTWNFYSTGAGAYRFYVGAGGTIYATSIVITAISDERLKENIKDIDTGLDSIMALKPRRFDWKEGKGQNKKNAAGFIAQEFETVFPECVGLSKAGADGIEYKDINHETLIPTLVKAIQELKAEIDSLKQQLGK
jgi:hypothetical protein